MVKQQSQVNKKKSAKPKTLAEAMRKGASKTKPLHDEFFAKNGDLKACPLGAAYVGIGNDPIELVQERLKSRINDMINDEMSEIEEKITGTLRHRFPILKREITCPIERCGRYETPFDDSFEEIIIHLTDDHEWSRDRVIKWVSKTESELKRVDNDSK